MMASKGIPRTGFTILHSQITMGSLFGLPPFFTPPAARKPFAGRLHFCIFLRFARIRRLRMCLELEAICFYTKRWTANLSNVCKSTNALERPRHVDCFFRFISDSADSSNSRGDAPPKKTAFTMIHRIWPCKHQPSLGRVAALAKNIPLFVFHFCQKGRMPPMATFSLKMPSTFRTSMFNVMRIMNDILLIC